MGGHAHEHRGPGQGLEHRLGAEAPQKAHLRGFEHGAVQGHKQAVDVINGQAVDKYVIGLPTPKGSKGLGIGQQIAVAQHGALGPPRGARGVKNGREILRAPGDGREDLPFRIELRSQGVEGEATTAVGVRCQRLWRGQHRHGRRGVGEEVGHFRRRIGGIEGHIAGARAKRRQV